MDKDGLEKYYKKKPKEILVMDCVYLSSERDRVTAELRKAEREVGDLNRELAKRNTKLACLTQVNGKLTEAITSLRDGVLV